MPGSTAAPSVRPRAVRRRSPRTGSEAMGLRRPVEIPSDVDAADVSAGGKVVHLTNLRKAFWPELSITKGELLQYYADISAVLLPHLKERAMVMKRYPHGAHGEFFFMKRAPSPRPEWVELCQIEHDSGNVIGFPVINDLASLLWVVNLGCIDLNPWYSRCDDTDRPDYLHFDLDPVTAAAGEAAVPFERVLSVARIVNNALADLEMPAYAKTTGSRGIHVYVPIVRGPRQKEVWTFAKALAQMLARRHPELITAEYRIAKRPKDRVLVDYNQNAWGRTLASVYSVRPKPGAPVSMPVTWDEVERGVTIEQFNLRNAVKRVSQVGDLWKPLLVKRGRFDLGKVLGKVSKL
jgi:bifunctional non-homologous end joining protein LigD